MNANGSSEVSICLQSRLGRKVVSLAACGASTKMLYDTASEAFGYPVETLRGGFPPKPIPSGDLIALSDFVSNQERIQVEFGSKTGAVAAASTNRNKNATTNGTRGKKTAAAPNDGTRRSKRAASKAATEAMPAVIRAQEEYLKSTSASPSSRKKRARNTNPQQQQRGSTVPKPVTLSTSAGAGRRLADGATVANPRRTNRKHQQLLGGNTGQSSDISSALMGALQNKGKMGTVLRKGMKNAVETSYETTRSFSRLAAIQARTYEMTTNDTTGDGSSTGGGSLVVTYQGSVDKTRIEESVDCIPLDVLRAVMEAIYASNKEALRPENLSRLSPRFLWSCVHWFPACSGVPEMYRELLPELDWNFLRRRAEQLSEKALENKRQAMEADGDDGERASDVVAAVEHAMEHLQDYHAEERKAKQAQAAEARLRRLQEHQNNGAVWELTTPSEPDRDELRECIESSIPEPSNRIGESINNKITKWISQLMKDHNIHNWRELANMPDKQTGTISRKLDIPEDDFRSWVDYAQNESVSEIVIQICDGNVHAVELLTEYARSGSPKDLAGWRSIPEILLEQLQRACPQPTSDTHHWMELGTISMWCERAHRILQQYEWLNWYNTPVA